MIKNILFIVSGVIILSFTGIKYDTEFFEPAFFIKHRPTLKFNYYSPIGESDETLNELSEDRKKEEIAYQEFVGNYYQHDTLDNYAEIIIQVAVFLILFGSIRLSQQVSRISWRNVLIENGIGFLLFLCSFALDWGTSVPGQVSVALYLIGNTLVIYYFEKRIMVKHNRT